MAFSLPFFLSFGAALPPLALCILAVQRFGGVLGYCRVIGGFVVLVAVNVYIQLKAQRLDKIRFPLGIVVYGRYKLVCRSRADLAAGEVFFRYPPHGDKIFAILLISLGAFNRFVNLHF